MLTGYRPGAAGSSWKIQGHSRLPHGSAGYSGRPRDGGVRKGAAGLLDTAGTAGRLLQCLVPSCRSCQGSAQGAAWVLLPGYCRLLQGTTMSCRVPHGIAGYSKALQAVARYGWSWVTQDMVEKCREQPGSARSCPQHIAECCQGTAGKCRKVAPPGTAKFCLVLPAIAGSCRVLPETGRYCRKLQGPAWDGRVRPGAAAAVAASQSGMRQGLAKLGMVQLGTAVYGKGTAGFCRVLPACIIQYFIRAIVVQLSCNCRAIVVQSCNCRAIVVQIS